MTALQIAGILISAEPQIRVPRARLGDLDMVP
jgi:hypothetical protein